MSAAAVVSVLPQHTAAAAVQSG
eukprot:ctg_7332.g550